MATVRPVRVRLSAAAKQDLARMERTMRDRMNRAVDRLRTTGGGDLRPLQGRPGEFRLRVGDWRLLMVVTSDLKTGARVLEVTRVLPRGSAYS